MRQTSGQDDVWLWDGAGITPNRAEYAAFLQSAAERLTVRIGAIAKLPSSTDSFMNRKHPVKTLLPPLKIQSWPQKHVILPGLLVLHAHGMGVMCPVLL